MLHNIRIRMGPDRKPHFYQRKDRNDYYFSELAIWDGKGIVDVERSIFYDWLSKPDICSEFEVDGFQMVIVDWQEAFLGDMFRCMEDSIAAHRLAIFNLLYWQDLRLRHNETKAGLNSYLVPSLHMDYHVDFAYEDPGVG